MSALRSRWSWAIGLSLAGHVAAVAFSLPADEGEAGSGASSPVLGSPIEAVLGDAIPIEEVVPDPTEAAQPATETPPAETKPVEMAEGKPVDVKPVEAEPVEAAEARPIEAAPPAPPAELAPIEADLPAMTDPVATAEPPERTPVTVPPEAKPAQEIVAVEPEPVAPAAQASEPEATEARPAPTQEARPEVKAEPETPKPAKAKPDPQKAEKPKKPSRPKGNAEASLQKGAASPIEGSKARDGGAGHARVAGDGAFDRSSYKGKVQAKLRRALRYPKAEERKRIGGTARVSFTILANGSVTGLGLDGSSGNDAIDQAALDTVRRAAPFPPLPPEADLARFDITAPIRFDPRR